MTNSTSKENAETSTRPIQRLVMCECYPKHCEHGTTCWCEPTVVRIDGVNVIIHNKAN